MSESTKCQVFFNRRKELNKDFWSKLGAEFPNCRCEKVSVSEFSPCLIDDHETLLSVVTSKSYISKRGQVEPTLFDNRLSNGISTDRKQHTTLAEYKKRSAQLVKENEKKTDFGSIELAVKSIRSMTHKGKRVFAVYDTGLEKNPSHAEIVQTEIPSPKTPCRTKIRSQLRRKILDACLHEKKVVPPSDIFEAE